MNYIVLQEHLYKAVTTTSRILSGKVQLPILQSLLLEAKEQTITITGSTIETTITTTLPGKVIKPGSLCIPAKLFTDLVATLPKEQVTISAEKEIVTIVCDKTKATIPGVSGSEFPPVPTFEEKTGSVFPKASFISAVERVAIAATTDESRPMLQGVRIEGEDGKVTLVATDGYRLSMETLPIDQLFEQPITIPSRSLYEIVKVLQEDKEAETGVLTETLDGQIVVRVEGTTLMTRKLEGEYPNYRRIIPTNFTTTITVGTTELKRAVKSASLFAQDSAGVIKLAIQDSNINISANTPQVGENTIAVEGEGSGEGCVVAINSRFLVEVLSRFPGEDVTIEASGAVAPVVFKTPQHEGFLHIIMPVRVQE